MRSAPISPRRKRASPMASMPNRGAMSSTSARFVMRYPVLMPEPSHATAPAAWKNPTPMDAPRGILRPAAVGRVFDLDRVPPPPDLLGAIEHHWRVAWDLRGRPAYRSEVLTHPSVHVVFEPHGAFLY